MMISVFSGCVKKALLEPDNESLLYITTDVSVDINDTLRLMLYSSQQSEPYQYTISYRDTIISLPSGDYTVYAYNNFKSFALKNENKCSEVSLNIESSEFEELKDFYTFSASGFSLSPLTDTPIILSPVPSFHILNVILSVTGLYENVFEYVNIEISGLTNTFTLSTQSGSGQAITLKSADIQESNNTYTTEIFGFAPEGSHSLSIKYKTAQDILEQSIIIPLDAITEEISEAGNNLTITLNPVLEISNSLNISLKNFTYTIDE